MQTISFTSHISKRNLIELKTPLQWGIIAPAFLPRPQADQTNRSQSVPDSKGLVGFNKRGDFFGDLVFDAAERMGGAGSAGVPAKGLPAGNQRGLRIA